MTEEAVTGLQLARLLQLASPALPIGAYSYSSGLESALEQGLVADVESAFLWIADAVEVVQARFDAAIVAAAAGARPNATDEIDGLDELVLAGRETVELRLEAEQMGYSLAAWMARVPAVGDGAEGAEGAEGVLAVPVAPVEQPGSTGRSGPVVFGRAAARLGLAPSVAATAWLWGFAENQIMVLIKAMPLGQIGGQQLLWRLGPVVTRGAATAASLPREQWSNGCPGLALASMAHERQYSRLFRS